MVERKVGSTSCSSNVHGVVDYNSIHYRSMVKDAMRMNLGYTGEYSIIDEELNANAIRFFKLLKYSDKPLWDGCTNHSKLLYIANVFTIKSNHEMSEVGYDRIIEWVRSILSEENRLKENFHAAKSMIKPFDLGY
jgi:hypothetical protein